MGLIYFFYKILYNKSYPTIDSILFFGITMILHFSLFRSREEFKYFRLFSSQIYLVDLLLFCILFFFTGYKYQGERLKKGESSIIEDNPDLISEDILHRKILVEEISKQVNHTISEKAVSIAIQSEWGYGKTVFLKFLKLELEKNKDNIIIEFNPWKVEREQNSLKRFFDALESELKKYDSGIQKQLVAYSNKLFEVSSEENVFSKLLKMLFSSFLSLDEGLDQQYKNINESIKRIGKRIIVLIDDLDRLSAPELIDVIRLIRNTGDFTNTVFIAAFDRNYVYNLLYKNGEIIDKNNYLEKIFQYDYLLPPIRPQVIRNEFLKYFDDLFIDKISNPEWLEFERVVSNLSFDENDSLSKMFHLPYQGTLFELYFKTLRDVIRFANSFRLPYIITRQEVDFQDFFMLEMIKFKYPNIYKMLAKRELLKLNPNKLSESIFDTEKFETLFKSEDKLLENGIPKEAQKILKKTIEAIYNSQTDNSKARQARENKNHYLYYNYQLFNIISLREFRQNRGKSYEVWEEFIINEYSSNPESLDEYLEVIDKISDYSNQEEYETFFKTILLCGELRGFSSIDFSVNVMIRKGDVINQMYAKVEKLHSDFIKNEILKNENFKVLNRIEVLSKLLYEELTGQGLGILDRESLIKTNLDILTFEISNNPNEEEIIYNLLVKNWSNIEYNTKKIIINPDACKSYRSHLNSFNKEFIKNCIRPYIIPVQATFEYTLDPFIPQIFGNYGEFKSFINDKTQGKCKAFILDKIDLFEKSNYKPIVIEDFNINDMCD